MKQKLATTRMEQKTIPPKTNHRYKAELGSTGKGGRNAEIAPPPRIRYQRPAWFRLGKENPLHTCCDKRVTSKSSQPRARAWTETLSLAQAKGKLKLKMEREHRGKPSSTVGSTLSTKQRQLNSAEIWSLWWKEGENSNYKTQPQLSSWLVWLNPAC